MGLTILAIPLIVLGVFIKPYSAENLRCFSVSFASARPYCFERGSNLPEVIKYSSVLAASSSVLSHAGQRDQTRARVHSRTRAAKARTRGRVTVVAPWIWPAY